MAAEIEDPWELAGGAYIHKKGDYRIGTTRINTEVKLLKWIYHLSEKNWISREDIFFLIRRVGEDFGLDLHNV
jgi:hypothetical protein